MLKLGEKIKSLRKQKNISQEVLADYLGVSFQAVSKWETNSAMPDVAMIPAIASFFGVSTDELFDFNLYEIERNVEAIVVESGKYYRSDKAKCEQILRDGLKKYPGNDVLLNCLIGVIPIPERADEVIDICKALTLSTKMDDVRIDAYRIMAQAYKSIGEIAMARDAIEHIPEIYFSKLEVAAELLDGEEMLEAAARQKSLSFDSLVSMCMRMADYYEAKNDKKKALTLLTMAKNVLLSVTDDFATPYSRPLFEVYGDKVELIDKRIEKLV